MRSYLFPGMLLAGLVLNASPAQAERRTTGADIIRMHRGGLKEETILTFLRTYRAKVVLEGKDLADLAEAGLTDGFIQSLLTYAKTQRLEQEETARSARSSPDPDEPRAVFVEEGSATGVYPRAFYVGYPYDELSFPFWFYVGLHVPFYRYHGYYGPGWGHSWGYGRGHSRWHGWGAGFGAHRGGGHRH